MPFYASFLHRSVLCLALLAALSFHHQLSADESNSRQMTVDRLSIGFSGKGRVGNWLPIEVTASGVAPGELVLLEVTADDPKGDRCESIVADAGADADGKVRLTGVLMAGRQDGVIGVRILTALGSVLWQSSVKCLPEPESRATVAETPVDRELILIRHQPLTVLAIGAPAGLKELSERLVAAESDTMQLLTLHSMQQLPAVARGLDAVDVVVLNSEYDLSEAQADNLRNWVHAGGHLIVSCGERLQAFVQSPLAAWLKPEFGISDEPMRSQDLSAVQNFVAGASQLQTNRQNVSLTRLTSDQIKIVVQSINGPLIARISAGAGVVTFVAVDLNQRPMSRWISLPQLYEMLLFDRLLDLAESQTRQHGRISSSGVTDLSTQLAAVSDAIPPEDRWSSWHAMLLMLIYMVVIGPLDYLIVVRLLGRPRLTWITFPALVGVACSYAVWSAASRDHDTTVRSVQLLDVSRKGDGQYIRQRTWSSVSTSETKHSAVEASRPVFAGAIPATIRESLIWHGRAEDVYGGLYRPGGAGLGRQTMNHTSLGTPRFVSLPMLIDGSQALLHETTLETDAPTVFRSELTMPTSGLLEGSFQHDLPAAIENWVIVFGNRVYLPSAKADSNARRIEPGTPWQRHSGNVRVTEIRDFLRGIRVVERSQKDSKARTGNTTTVQTPYNSSGRNPLDILLMISLYNTAGGEVYTKLQNDCLRRDEISDSSSLSQALLIGTTDLAVPELTVDTRAHRPAYHQTIVRLFLPVRRLVSDGGIREADPTTPGSAGSEAPIKQ